MQEFIRRGCVLLLPLALLYCGGALAASVTLDVQAVAASDAGKDKEVSIPATLDSYKTLLKQSGFKTFKDSGRQSVKAGEGEKATAQAGGYSLDLTVTKIEDGKCKVAVTIKDGDKPIGNPTSIPLAKGRPMQMQVGNADAPTILILNLRETK